MQEAEAAPAIARPTGLMPACQAQRFFMSRFIPAAAFALLAFGVPPSYAQTPARSQHNAFPAGVIEGRVLDAKQAPVAGAMVSVLGRATAGATTDRDGRHALKDL